MKRDGDARHAAHFMAPHAAAIDDIIGFNGALIIVISPINTRNPSILFLNGGDFDVFKYLSTLKPCAFGKGQRDVGGVALSIFGQINTADHIINVEMLITLLDFGWGDFFHFNTKGAGHGGLAEDFFFALIIQRDGH